MSSALRRRTSGGALIAAVCAAVLFPLPSAHAALVADPIIDAAPDAAFTLTPTGTFETGVFDESASEIVHAYGDRLFAVNAAEGSISALDMAEPSNLAPLFTIGADGYVANSLAIRDDGLDVVALEDAADKTADGALLFFDANADEPAPLGTVPVGALPDMVTLTDDGAYAVVANEGEPADDFSSDPEGSIGVVSLPPQGSIVAPAASDVRTAGFEAFEDGALPDGVRVFGPAPHGDDRPVSRNLEPEYIAISGDTAYAALQENNAVAVIDIPRATVTDIWPLGHTDWSTERLDASDRDPEGAPTINLQSYEGLYGIRMPDGIVAYEVDGETYLVTANEGDAREWGDYVEVARVKHLGTDDEDTGEMIGYGPVCDDAFDAAVLGDDQLGRLEVTIESGFNADRGCYDELYAFGARSFSIFTADGELVSDSGGEFEELAARLAESSPLVFLSGHDTTEADARSTKKGVEPENLDIGVVDGRPYAFIGFERLGGIIAYDISDPAAPQYVSYVNNRDFGVSVGDEIDDDPTALSRAGDLGTESVEFIAAEDSPTGEPLLAVGNEVSGTTTIMTIDVAPEPTPAPTTEPEPSASPEPTAEPEPTEEPSGVPTAEPTESPAPSPTAPTPSSAPEAPEDLSATGGDVTVPLSIGALVLALGGVALLVLRRRRRS